MLKLVYNISVTPPDLRYQGKGTPSLTTPRDLLTNVSWIRPRSTFLDTLPCALNKSCKHSLSSSRRAFHTNGFLFRDKISRILDLLAITQDECKKLAASTRLWSNLIKELVKQSISFQDRILNFRRRNCFKRIMIPKL